MISASLMPPESMRGSPTPAALMALNALMMPVTVPSRPSSGLDRGDRAEGVQEALELMHDMPPGVLQSLHHDRARSMAAGEALGEHASQRRILLQGGDHLVGHLPALDQLPDLLQQARRHHALLLEGPEALHDDADGGDGAEDDRPHERAAGPHDFPHLAHPTCRNWRDDTGAGLRRGIPSGACPP